MAEVSGVTAAGTTSLTGMNFGGDFEAMFMAVLSKMIERSAAELKKALKRLEALQQRQIDANEQITAAKDRYDAWEKDNNSRGFYKGNEDYDAQEKLHQDGIKNLEAAAENDSTNQQAELIKVQMHLAKYNQLVEAFSNMAKKSDDAKSSIIGNFR